MNYGLSTEQRRALLLLRVAVALAAYRYHAVVEQSDLEQAARLLSRDIPTELIDIGALIA